MKIAIFDSGIGGLSVFNAVKKSFPQLEIVFRNDQKNMPYGDKTKNELLLLVKPFFDQFQAENFDIVIIACNTVSTTILSELREQYKFTIIPVIPMIREASLITKNKTIAICATPTTLKSSKYSVLKFKYGQNLNILEPDCREWATMIQKKQINEMKIKQTIEDILNKKCDVVVLACTHYHWIENDIKKICFNRASVIQPEEKIIAKLKQLL